MPSGIEPSAGYQSSWVRAPGHVSLADIVKMGRPHNKASNTQNASHHNVKGPSTSASHHSSRLPEDNMPIIEEWPSIEKPAATKVTAIPEYTMDSEQHQEAPGVHSESITRYSEAEEVQETEDDNIEVGDNDVGSDSTCSRKLQEDDTGGASMFENDFYENMGSYQQQAHDLREGDFLQL